MESASDRSAVDSDDSVEDSQETSSDSNSDQESLAQPPVIVTTPHDTARPRAHIRSSSSANITTVRPKELKRTISVNGVYEIDEDLVHYADKFEEYHEHGKNKTIELERVEDNVHQYKYSRCYFLPTKEMIKYSIGLGIEYDRYRSRVKQHYITDAHRRSNPHLTSPQYGLLVILVNLTKTSAIYLRTLLELLKSNRGYCYDRTPAGDYIPFFNDLYVVILIRDDLQLLKVEDVRKNVVVCPVPMLYYTNFHFFELRIEENRLEVYPRDSIKPLTENESFWLFSEGNHRRRLQTVDKITDLDFYLLSTSDLLQINLDAIIGDI